MILQALADYYQRKAETDQGALAPEGFELKAIPFVLVLDDDGRLVQLADRREGESRERAAKPVMVPQAVKRTSGVAANLLWDTAEYILGIDTKADASRASRVAAQQAAFRAKLGERLSDQFDDAGVRAVLRFLDHNREEALVSLEAIDTWPEILKTNPLMTFQLSSDTCLICQRQSVVAALVDRGTDSAASTSGLCIISGEVDVIERVHPAIKGVWGAQPSGANIVGVNNKNESGNNGGETPAFASYGKQQGYNSPIGEHSAFAYTTALNHLLAKGSRQRVQVGDASTVFWAEKESGAEFERAFLGFLNLPADPDSGSTAIASLFQSARHGRPYTSDDAQRFHVLGLSPNAARLSVRFWHVATIAELGRSFARYFDDVAIVRPAYDAGAPLTLFRLLLATAVLGKAANITPSLGGDVMRAVLTGGPYPEVLIQGALRRVRAERDVTWQRAALMKAYLIRNSHDEEITVSLNEDNVDPGYRLGRMFAALERAQERAQGNLNASIRERYYGAFSAAPVTVLPMLMKLKNHHLAKLPNRGEAVNLEKLFGAIMDGVDDVPARLTLTEQARFAVGYYHQRQALFANASTPEDHSTD